MKAYKMIRGATAEARCKNKSRYGSPMYCDCGCQTPQDSDPALNQILAGVTAGKKGESYANVDLMRDGVRVGNINTQYSAVFIDGFELLECNGIDALLAAAREVLNNSQREEASAGDSLEETAANVRINDRLADQEQNERNRKHPGWCPKCHTYCYGDCEAE